MAPFRFAVQLSNASSGASWRDLARTIEGLGYSTLFIPDHFEDQFGPLVALTVAAEATSTLKVGSLVFGNDYRHPIVLAKEIATLDLMSEGRVEFGLGAGWMTTDYEQSGIANDPAGVRISRMAESAGRHEVAVVDGGGHLHGGALHDCRCGRGAAAPQPALSEGHHRRRRQAGPRHRRPRGRHRGGQSEPGRWPRGRRGPGHDDRRVLRPAHRVGPRGGGRPVRRPRTSGA